LSRELRELSCVAQVPWERTIKYLLLAMCDRCTCRVGFSLTSFWRRCRGFVFQHKTIGAVVTLLEFVVCFFVVLSFMQFVYRCLCFPLIWFVLNACLGVRLRAWCSCWKVLGMGFRQPI